VTAALGRHPHAVIVTVVLVLAVPYAIAGPNFLADDWVFLRNARFDGVLGAAGARQTGRPGAIVIYDLTFGAIGAHPLLLYVVQVGLWVVAALAVYAALRAFFPVLAALATTLVWLVVPNHSTLEMWASTSQALIALALLAVGVRGLARAADRDEWSWWSVVAIAAAIAFYEVTAAAALAAVVIVPLLRGWRPRWGTLIGGVAVVALPVVWRLANPSVYGAPTGRMDYGTVIPNNLSLGLKAYSEPGRIVAALALAAGLWALVRVARAETRDQTGPAERLAIAGLVIIGLGVAPLVGFRTNFLGMEDRLTVVSGVGGAMVWTGAGWMVVNALRTSRAAVTAFVAVGAAVLLAIVIPIRAERTRDFDRAGDRALAQAHDYVQITAANPIIAVDGPVADSGRIDGLNDGWNATAATQALSGGRVRVVLVRLDGIVTGPSPDNPLQTFH
jgi:hypothetical protein